MGACAVAPCRRAAEDKTTVHGHTTARRPIIASGFGSASKVRRMVLQIGGARRRGYLLFSRRQCRDIIAAPSSTSRALAPVELAIRTLVKGLGRRNGQSWKRLQQLMGAAPGQGGRETPLPPAAQSHRPSEAVSVVAGRSNAWWCRRLL